MSNFYRIIAFTFFIVLFVLALPRPALAQGDALIEDIEVNGNRRIPKETVLYSVQSKPGDLYSEAAVRRDFQAVIGIGVFDPMAAKLLVADGPRGGNRYRKMVDRKIRKCDCVRMSFFFAEFCDDPQG